MPGEMVDGMNGEESSFDTQATRKQSRDFIWLSLQGEDRVGNNRHQRIMQ